ncbi:MAG TPA: sigma-70 family RNA polymerase sigma factor [Acidimicrobiia bacterium]|nr:sigma-70 family RNA polymerase sigma factor [Acidimicrobiia bacterium]
MSTRLDVHHEPAARTERAWPGDDCARARPPGHDPQHPPRSAFAEYQLTRDRGLRDRLVEGHLNMAYAAARRFAGRGEDLEDLKQVALLALVQAVDRFDPSMGLAFSTFATPTIVGTLKRHLRDRTWAVRPPRPVQERYLELAALGEALTHELGRSPTMAEIATRAKCSEDQVHEALDAASVHRRHDALASDRSGPFSEPGRIDQELDRVETRATVEDLLDALPEREREIVKMRFYDGLAQSAIAHRIGVSQMQVSRLLAQSLTHLRGLAAERTLSPS